MGIFLMLVATGLMVSAGFYYGNDKNKASGIISGIIYTIIVTAIMSCAVLDSYESYLFIESNRAVMHDYHKAITDYKHAGSLIGSKPGVEITDMKYNNYQSSIAEMITAYRENIVSANKKWKSKSIMKQSWLFSWLIVLPDDCKMLKMVKP